MKRASPLDIAREQRGRAERALAEANAASTRLQEARARAQRLLGGSEPEPPESSGEDEELTPDQRRMAEIERRMYVSEELMRRAEGAMVRNDPADDDPAAGR